jgi:hypothetical protein
VTTFIYLTNGQSVQTTSNNAADIAGLVNAGTPKIYQCNDAQDPNLTHNIVTAHIVDVYDHA